MSWDAEDVALLKKLWAKGKSAAQKRGHRPPTSKPKIVSVPKRRPALLAACARPVDKAVSKRKRVATQPQEFSKSQLIAMLAEAAANTARLLR
jgi:GcrA cell cycle regulator